MIEHEGGDTSLYTSAAERDAAWQRDRDTEVAPLPGAEQSHHSDEGQRQSALYGAEQANVARAAGELGITSDEWRDKRRKLGRSPTKADVKKP